MQSLLYTLLLSLSLATPSAHAESTAPVKGKDFDVIKPISAAPAQSGRVKVTEFFWYGCPHCAEFEPVLEAWAKREGNKIDLERVPVPLSEALIPHSRMYYTLAELGASEHLTSVLFNAIGKQRQPLLTPDDQAAFLEKYGIDKAHYLQMYNSPQVLAAVSQAARLIRDDRIAGVPTVVVADKYETGPGYTGGLEATTTVLDYLVKHAGTS
ncbi:thiol:disulfide interchange protein [Burkholderia ubonensis]|uniref:thiol:disulfide interchange protein DsbA/DsbL n=1 Tax=Burkholderia ubonensis TaxID=101571 RepID=UPI00075A49C1|nr:thiol:disulfide interchange protein DsbA/DsbL [Burkholderia ubonensis]KVT57788.1 thiol:disulfide interchange protein [Burkholderia ubonensis]